MDDMFWATKLHFHMTGVQFYNFPYTFGYLFALGVYAQQESKVRISLAEACVCARERVCMCVHVCVCVCSREGACMCLCVCVYARACMCACVNSLWHATPLQLLLFLCGGAAVERYLFCAGVRGKQGEDFHQAYVDLLRDTGRMSAEDVVQKHLGCSIEDPGG